MRALRQHVSIMTALLLGLSPVMASAEYPAPPSILQQKVKAAAETLAQVDTSTVGYDKKQVGSKLDLFLPELELYTVADALNSERVRTLKVDQALGEVSRTDKQVGASATASGSTTLVEKPDFAALIGFGIERGAITQENTGSSITLSTSPYLLATLKERDTAPNYKKYELLRRVGFSASFSLENPGSSAGQNIDVNKMEQWSVKWRLWGDRSTRSEAFVEQWQKDLGWKYDLRGEALTGGSFAIGNDSCANTTAASLKQTVSSDGPIYLPLIDKVDHILHVSSNRQADIEQALWESLAGNILVPIRNGTLCVSDKTRTDMNTKVLPTLSQSQAQLSTIKSDLDKVIDNFNKQLVATLAYTNHRVRSGSGFSEVKLIADGRLPIEQLLSPDLILNGGVSLFHDPDRKMGQETVRDYGLSVSLEWTMGNFVAEYFVLNQFTAGPITLAFSGRFERMQADHDNVGVAQVKLDIPITSGFSLPLSVTYASRSDLVDEARVHGNIGFTFDTDKLFALRSALLTGVTQPAQ